MYYHLSYLGTPHDNLWIATTAPQLMYEELLKAYTAGANRYWLLNVGDIKLMVQYILDNYYRLAWNLTGVSRSAPPAARRLHRQGKATVGGTPSHTAQDAGGTRGEPTNEARAEPSLLELCLARRRKT